MSTDHDRMRNSLALACQAAQICRPNEIVFDRDRSAFRIGTHGFQVHYDATRRGGPTWNVQELYDTPNPREGGHEVRIRLVGHGGVADHAMVARLLAVEIVSKAIDHALDAAA